MKEQSNNPTLSQIVMNTASALDEVQCMLRLIELQMLSKGQRQLPANAADIDMVIQSICDVAQLLNNIGEHVSDDIKIAPECLTQEITLEWLRLKIAGTRENADHNKARAQSGQVIVF